MGEVPLLNNPTVASLVGGLAGAFSAFLLVIINDWRRDKRRIQTIRNEIQLNREHAEAKIETLKSNRDVLSGRNKLIPAPVLKFTPGIIRGIAVEVLHKFSSDQRQALDGNSAKVALSSDVVGIQQVVSSARKVDLLALTSSGNLSHMRHFPAYKVSLALLHIGFLGCSLRLCLWAAAQARRWALRKR